MLVPVVNPGGICKGTVITNCSQDLPRIDGTAERLNYNRVLLNTTNFISKYTPFYTCSIVICSLETVYQTLILIPPTDMARKPRPPPLAYSRALIENERLAVMQRTAHRLHQLTGDKTDTGDKTYTNPTGKYLPYAKIVAFGVIF